MGKIKKILPVLVLAIVLAGSWYGYKSYKIHQQKILEQKKAEEAAKLKQQEEEKKKRELEQAKKEFEGLIAQMKDEFKKKNYAGVRALAEKAKKIASARKFPTDEIDKILLAVDVDIATGRIKKIKPLASDPYSYFLLRTELKKIPRYAPIASEWDRLWIKTFANEYIVLLQLAGETVEKGLKGEDPETNYSLSKTYYLKAVNVRRIKNLSENKEAENKLRASQNELFFSYLQKTTVPAELYR